MTPPIAIKYLFTLVPLASAGCGPGQRIPAAWVGTTHPSLRWMYKSGWQLCVVAPPKMLPWISIYSNGIRNFKVEEQRVVLREDATGDFGGGLWASTVSLNLATGERRALVTKCASGASRPDVAPQPNARIIEAQLPEAPSEGDGSNGEIRALGGELEIRSRSEPRFSIDLRDRKRAAGEWVRLVHCARQGGIDQTLLLGDEGLMLISFYVARPLTGDVDGYLMCVDLGLLQQDAPRVTTRPVPLD